MRHSPDASDHSLLAGFSKACITPPLGMPMEGLAQKGGCTAIHDDLWVRALFLGQGDREVLILSFDLLFFDRAQVARLKGSLSRALGLTAAEIFINTTHTHAGPRVTRWAYSDGPESLYVDQIEAAMIGAARSAWEHRRAVTLHAGVTSASLPVSRRRLGEDGKARWRPSRSAPVCDALPYCLFKDAEGGILWSLDILEAMPEASSATRGCLHPRNTVS